MTIVIARGALTNADRQLVARYSFAHEIPQIAAYTADALAFIEALDVSGGRVLVTFDMDVGDY